MGAFSYQDNRYSCGVHAVMNALVALGKNDVSYDEIKALAGTTSRNGTSDDGVVQCLEQLGFRATIYETQNVDNAWRWLYKWSDKQPIIVLVDQYKHWACVNGKIDHRVILVDPDPELHKHQNGVYSCNKAEMLERWMYKGCYGVRVGMRS